MTYFFYKDEKLSSQINGKFHLNQSEDDNQGNSLSESSEDSSEKLRAEEA